MRGTPCVYVEPRAADCVGIIPAYAGNTIYSSFLRCLKGDHPRVCGEHLKDTERYTVERGSSPRMRGTHHLDRRHGRFHGIIPAYAGNTSSSASPVPQSRDHPRVCGEHKSSEIMNFSMTGSSPRMRGTPFARERSAMRPGIIPAYAGNTEAVPESFARFGDHPRVCGEHFRVF